MNVTENDLHKRPNLNLTPEEWVAEEKQMPGALQGYQYVEDMQP